MEQLFLRLAHMSLAAGWVVLAVLVLRLALRKAPKRIVCLLWVLVAFRLICPVTLRAPVSLVPQPPAVSQMVSPEPRAPEDAADAVSTVPVLSRLWCAGVAGMLSWALWSNLRLRRRLQASIRKEDNIRLCDEIDTPFAFGLIRPQIYLPSWLEPEQADYVLAHERAHIARGDHWWKPLGWALLSVYWFHPLLWLGYVLFCRDLEFACDERVAAGLDREGLAAYSEALLRCSRPNPVMPLPVAFGEIGVKARVQAILRYRRPTVRVVVLAVLAVLAAGVLFLTDRPVQALELPEVSEEAAEPAPLADDAELQEFMAQKADLLDAARSTPSPTPQPETQATTPAQTYQTQTYPAQMPAPQVRQQAAETTSVPAPEPTPAPTPPAEEPGGERIDIVDSGGF